MGTLAIALDGAAIHAIAPRDCGMLIPTTCPTTHTAPTINARLVRAGGRRKMPKDPETIEELRDYILEHASDIYVRETVADKWDAYSLASLPPMLAMKHAMRFLVDGRIPVYIHRDHKEN